MWTSHTETAKPQATQRKGQRRLERASLSLARSNVRRPGFDPASLGRGILHLGCGAFHRAHQAVATQRAIEAEGKAGLQWGISAAAMTRTAVPGQLQPQDGLYTALERSENGTTAEIIGTLREVVHAPTDAAGLPARIASPRTRLVSLTITPPGYMLEPATGRLQAGHKDVLYDLHHPERPRSAIGAIAHGLARIRASGQTPPVFLSCDNIATNGHTLKRAVASFAALQDDTLARWIETNVRFPNTMVDRIVPAFSKTDQEDAERLLGLQDAAPVSMEPYMQWIIESFDGARPRWEAAGARFVADAGPYELAKLRLLNGTHMLLAYLGALAGFKTIADTMADPLFAAFAESFMLHEQGATLNMGEAELHTYVAQLMHRLRNPAIRHDVARVGRNGSVKLATRLIHPLRENISAGRHSPCAIIAIAAWIRSFALRDTKGTQVHPIDPRKDALKALCETTGEDHLRQAKAFLALEPIFGPQMPNHEAVEAELAQALRDLHLHPVHDVLRRRFAAGRETA